MRKVLLVPARSVIAQIEEILCVWRGLCKLRQWFEKLRSESLLVAVLLCSACAGAQPAMHTITRAERAAARDARETKLVELAKRHPNAFPRDRTACPEKAPAGATLNCPYSANGGKPWL
jgi:hypothetical protein